MKQIKRIYRLWIYGFGIAIYTHLIVLLSIVPVAIPFVIVRRMTTDQTILHRTDLVLKVVGAIVSPLVFGWLFYLLIGRRLRWHDLRTEIEK